MLRLIAALMLALPPQAPQPLPPQAPPSWPEPPIVRPFAGVPRAKLLEDLRTPTYKTVACGNYVTRINRSFADGSHEHVCPKCGTAWRHGGPYGPGSHACPGTKKVLVGYRSSWPPVPGDQSPMRYGPGGSLVLVVCSVDADRDGNPFVCKPCIELNKMLANVVCPTEIAIEIMKNNWYTFDSWKIDHFPTLILTEGGKEIRRHVGSFESAPAMQRWLAPAKTSSAAPLFRVAPATAICTT